ncbi:MAG: hypothetical protein KGI75_16715 [Rhizobiaceae bacterium]|nr:hypothetical protein [Rhizobiaceae bacterium]
MALTAENLGSNLNFLMSVLGYARTMVTAYTENPRMSSVFASQQRWLMAQAGYALHFRATGHEQQGLYARRFVDYVLKHEIASHNTAVNFIQEMLAYRYMRYIPDPAGRRTRPLEPTEIATEQFVKWFYTHLLLLDGVDGGARMPTFMDRPEIFATLQPMIATAIITNNRVRHPGETFDLFTWANSGGVVMDYLISRLDTVDLSVERSVIGPISFGELCDSFLISRTNLKRLMNKASQMQSVGWTGAAGKSDFWISRSFIREYWDYQAEKFAIIAAAWEEIFGAQPEPAPKPELISAVL